MNLLSAVLSYLVQFDFFFKFVRFVCLAFVLAQVMEFLPYFVFWLITKDLISDLDTCSNDFYESGFCLSEWQCSKVVNGTSIGSCGNERSGDACCKIHLQYFDRTYYLTHLFTSRGPLFDKLQRTRVFDADKHDSPRIHYKNKSLTPGRRQRFTYVDPNIQSPPPNEIVVPVNVRNDVPKRSPLQRSKGNYLYAVRLEKVDSHEDSDDHDGQYRVMVQEPENIKVSDFRTENLLQSAVTSFSHDGRRLHKRTASDVNSADASCV